MGLYYLMNFIKKNTWLLFYLIAFIGAVLVASAIYLKHEGLIKEAQIEQRYVTKIFNNQITSLFIKYETILDLIGDEFTLNKTLNIQILDKTNSKTELLVGFGLFTPDGSLWFSSSNLNKITFPNLLANKDTKKWFKETLQQDQLNIGKPYLLSAINKWVIPIRKRLINSQGEVFAVMTTGIDLSALSQLLNETDSLDNVLQITLDKNFYRILRTDVEQNNYEKPYNYPITLAALNSIKLALQRRHLTLDDLRQSTELIQISSGIDLGIAKKESILTVVYNKKFQFWITAMHFNENIYDALYPSALIYCFLYLLLMSLFFTLFKWIIRIELAKLAELTYKTEHDALTGLYNSSILRIEAEKLHEEKVEFSVLYLDLNHFRNVNDTFGHRYGDLILIEVSKRIVKSLHFIQNTIIRFSGDEFVIVLESAQLADITEYTEILLNDIDKPYLINNNVFRISASIGIALCPQDSSNIETLVSYACNSMLLAKGTKEQYLFFTQQVHRNLIKNIEIEQALKHAISNNEISMVYQPQLDQNEDLIGVEALVRWHNESLGFIAPDVFIPIAENMGLMPSLGLYIMDCAMAEISSLQKQKKRAFQLSINVSARQFMQVDFFDELIKCYQSYQSEFLTITVEITESLFIENIETLQPIFHQMKKNNILLSLDDFGTGYSSLSMLRKVPIDELKIDKSFVDHITTNQSDKAMVQSIISMGKNLGMQVLAEGVETKGQLTILKQSGCDLFQGYYFSKPLTLKNLAIFVEEDELN